jgi:pimeloyl-ACP methyl ester carboxylesterase
MWTAGRRGAPLAAAARRLHLNHAIVEPAASTSTASTSSEPLLLLHGLFGSSSNFRTPARSLNAHRTVVLPDLRNHGASSHDDDCSILSMAKDVVELLDTLGYERATLCGHSLGGKVAAAAALLHPERVAKLIVVDIAPVAYPSAHTMSANSSIMDACARMAGPALADRKLADAALAAAAPALADAPGIRAFLLQNLLPDQARWRLNLPGLRAANANGVLADFPAHLPPAPASLTARFIAGTRSDYLLPSHRPAIERLFPGAEPETRMVEAGHWLHAEKPVDFVALVDGF